MQIRRPVRPADPFLIALPAGPTESPAPWKCRSTLLTQRFSRRVKVADSDSASDMQTTLFASAGAERGGEESGDEEKGVGPEKRVMNHESFSSQFKEREEGQELALSTARLLSARMWNGISGQDSNQQALSRN